MTSRQEPVRTAPKALAGGQDRVRVLHLEDNPVEAELIARRLADDGFAAEWKVVADELAFRRALVEFAPQVVLSDFSLPGFDGLSALRIAVEEAPSIPFIFVSGTIGEERAIEALKRGAADYVLKDNLKRLVPAIRAAVRQAEATRARELAEEMVRRGETRLKDIINTSRDWIWECDAEGRFTFSSPSVRDILGYGHHELLGRPAVDFVASGDERQLQALLAAESTAEPAAPVAIRWRHKNGKIRWLERTVVALRDANGVLAGFRGSDRDVTSRVAQDVRIRRLNRALRFMGGASSAVVRIRDRMQLLREACRLAVSVGGYTGATLYLLPLADGAQPEVCSYRSAQSGRSRWSVDGVLPDGENPVTRVLSTTNPFIVNDLEDGADAGLAFVPKAAELAASGVRALIALPLVVDGTAIGVLELHSAETNVFGEAELLLLGQVAANVAFALQYLHSRESAEYLQYFDPLTSLANRSLYRQRVAAMLESLEADDALALIAFDISGLGMVNDGLGHHAGDLLLQLVAERLKNTFRDSGLLCRLGGDRFAVLARGRAAESEAALEQQTIAAFDEPFAIRGRELRVSIHAGIAQATTGDARDAEALLQYAQTALEHAKEAGKRCLRHGAHMNARASRRLELTNDLRRAVAERAFSLCYQPKVAAGAGTVAGVEALLRWPRGGGAAVSPGEFVPMLESLGLIEEVGEWAIVRALLETSSWSFGGEPVRVAVNVSALQLGREDFAERTLGLLAEVPDATGRLELEVTETAVMADPARAAASLARLRDAGVTIAIDDFGTGHSSLKMLSSLPLDVLKIDRSFVRDVASNPSHRSIVQATVTLARSLRLRTVAEGVETEEQRAAIEALGCDYVQGFLVARPASAAETAEWIARQAWERKGERTSGERGGAARQTLSADTYRPRSPGSNQRYS